MKKSNLRSGDIVELRQEAKCIVLLNGRHDDELVDLLIDINDATYVFFDEYDENLEHNDLNHLDIVKVCANRCTRYNIDQHIAKKPNDSESKEWTWKREEEPKETTIDLTIKMSVDEIDKTIEMLKKKREELK